MTEDELEDKIATLVYFSKGRFNPQWVESMSYRRRLYYMRWLEKQLRRERQEAEQMLKQ
jgi:hypothetical protein